MKKLLIVLAVGGLAYGAYMLLPGLQGAFPEGRLRRVAEAPGTAVSRITLSSGDPWVLITTIGGVLLVLLLIYYLMTR